MKIRFIYPIFLLVVLNACSNQEQQEIVTKYKNALNLEAIPKERYDLQGFGFSDLGAWHGYALPEKDSIAYLGGFSGPLLMKMYGQWLSKSLCRLQLHDSQNQLILFDKGKTELVSMPGRLVQKIETGSLKISLTLLFADNRTSVIQTIIKNTSDTNVEFVPGWSGYVDWDDIFFTKGINGFDFNLKDSSSFQTRFSVPLHSIDFQNGELQVQANKVLLAPGEKFEVNFTQRYCFYEDLREEALTDLASLLKNVKKIDEENKSRWSNYLEEACSANLNENEKRLATKCVQTLITNWRSPAGALKHNGIFPSAAYQGFYGFWSWDSWKHSVAVAKFNPFLAKEGIRSMFDFQNKAGMVADCVYFDPKENNWRDTKAPLAAWSVHNVFKETGDTAFVSEMLPKLEKYHKWWYAERDHDKNGFCEYGSTDGTLVAAKWESGMDNAVRFDSTIILKNTETAWSFNQESVDLNAYLQKEKEYINILFAIVGEKQKATKYEEEAQKLKHQIRNYFWNDEKGYFFDRKLGTSGFVEDYGPEGWTLLWTGLADSSQASEVIKVVLDSSRFNTYVPFPTLDASHPKFNPLKGYWRGPVWLDQAYFGIRGLKNYGYHNEAKQLTRNIIYNSEGLIGDTPIRENYHPISGEGLNAKHFSWSAAHLLLLLHMHHCPE